MSAGAVVQQHRENVAHVKPELKAARASWKAYRSEVERMMSATAGTETPKALMDQYEIAVRRLSRVWQASIK